MEDLGASIFHNLPNDLIRKILLYDEHFIRRKGEIISIIPKTDNRYKLLHFITFTLQHMEKHAHHTIIRYKFSNLYNYEERQMNNSDLFEVSLHEYNDAIKYSIWIGKQYPKTIPCTKKQDYYIEKPLEYNWMYTYFEYVRQ